MYSNQNALKLAHRYLQAQVQPGDICVDATAGRGKDTVLLCHLTGPAGQVYAFDIQTEALQSTDLLLKEQGVTARLIQASHERLEEYVSHADIVVFNFGYLPGGDHRIRTGAQSSVAALKAALRILKPGGCISICIYYGGISGYEERDAILNFLATVDAQMYTVLVQNFINRPNCPPIFACIERNDERVHSMDA